jgi:hypothetical protein
MGRTFADFVVCTCASCLSVVIQGEAMFASKGLQTLVGKYQLRSAQESEKQKTEAAEMYRGSAASRGVHDVSSAAANAAAAAGEAAAAVSPATAVAPAGSTGGHHEAWGEKHK